VVARKPASSATGVSRTSNVYATFSEAIRTSTITTSTFRLKDTTTGSIVPATVTYSSTYKRATLNPSVTLGRKHKYQVLVSSGIRDRAGNPLYATSWTFTTGS
jgi:Bacterial Ig-like domain